MAYLDNVDKVRGKNREPIIAERILKDLISVGINTSMRKSSINEDINMKYDYVYTFDEPQTFLKERNVTSVKVDIKSGESFTIVDSTGRDTLDNSQSDYIVFETYPYSRTLLWVSTKRLKACLKLNRPMLRESKYENGSMYFFIKKYLSDHDYFMNGYYKYI